MALNKVLSDFEQSVLMQVISILDFTSCKTCHRRKKITRKVQASLAIVVQIHLTQTLHNSTVNKINQSFSDETASKQSQVKTKILHNKNSLL